MDDRPGLPGGRSGVARRCISSLRRGTNFPLLPLFAGSLCFWSAQAIYARAFYAAGNTFTPMAASTLITAVSIPVYWFLFHHMGVMGLAIASDCGILVQTLALAWLLHERSCAVERAWICGAGQITGGGDRLLRRFDLASCIFCRLRVISSRSAELACGTAVWLALAWLVFTSPDRACRIS